MADSQGFPWDHNIWPMVAASNGVATALDVMKNGVSSSLSSGLHHARRDGGHAFCALNGLALPAFEALDEGAGQVLILDLDAHCGGGTRATIRDERRIWQIDVSSDGFDCYPESDHARLAPKRKPPKLTPEKLMAVRNLCRRARR